MSSIDTSLNSAATVTLKDLCSGTLKRGKTEADALRILRNPRWCGAWWARASPGDDRTKGLLDAWWKLSGIFAGGMLGLFLLGLISRRANNACPRGRDRGCVGDLLMTFPDLLLSGCVVRFAHMITVIGTLTIFGVGVACSRAR